jgi:integrase
MITKKYVLRDTKIKPDGTAPIWLRLTEHRRSRFVNTGLFLKPSYWDPKKCTIRKFDSSDALKSRLDQFNLRLVNTMAELDRDGRLNVDNLVSRLKREDGSMLFQEYAIQFLKSLLDDERYHAFKKTQVAVNKLEEFRGGKPIPLTDINSEMLGQFVKWLVSFKQNNPNTISKDVEGIRRILRQAHKDGIIKSVPDAEGVKRTKTTKEKLHPDQIEAIKAVELEPDSLLWHTRNYFLFSYYYAGIRWGDICTLKWSDIKDGKLYYVMSKTQKRYPAPFKIPEQGLEILEHYREGKKADDFIFPILKPGRDYSDFRFLNQQIDSNNSMINVRLKHIAKLAGIDVTVSFHVSRHSFAYLLLLNKASIYEISKALAHENLTVTETYLRGIDTSLTTRTVEEAYSKIGSFYK